MKTITLLFVASLLLINSCKTTTTGPSGTTTTPVVVFNHFEASGHALRGVWSIHNDGTALKQILNTGYLVSSPHGSQFVGMSSETATGYASIVMGSVDSNHVTVFANALVDGFGIGHPTLSSDGQHVLGYSYQSTDTGGIYVWDVVGSTGTNGRWLTKHSAYEAMAAFSPDGLHIAYYGSDLKMHIVRVDGSNDIAVGDSLTPGNDFFSSIQWVPAGDHFIFTTVKNNVNALWRVNADGTALVNMTATLPAFSANPRPVYSADGTRMVYISGTSAADAAIYIANSDGSGAQKLPISFTTQVPLFYAWSPDASQIAFTMYSLSLPDMDPDRYPGSAYVYTVATGVNAFLADSISYGMYWWQ